MIACHLLSLRVPIIVLNDVVDEWIVQVVLYELFGYRLRWCRVLLADLEGILRQQAVIRNAFFAGVRDIGCGILQILVDVALLVGIVQLDPPRAVRALGYVGVALDHQLNQERIVLFDLPSEDVPLVLEDDLADLVRLHEVLLQLDQLRHLLHLEFESRLHHVSVLDQLEVFEEFVDFESLADLLVLVDVVLEIEALLLCLVLVLLTDLVAALDHGLEHLFKQCASLFAHWRVQGKAEYRRHLIQLLDQVDPLDRLVIVFIRYGTIQGIENYQALREIPIEVTQLFKLLPRRLLVILLVQVVPLQD